MLVPARVIEAALDSLLPSWWEIEVTFASAVFVIIAYRYFTFGDARCESNLVESSVASVVAHEGEKIGQLKYDTQTISMYMIKSHVLISKRKLLMNRGLRCKTTVLVAQRVTQLRETLPAATETTGCCSGNLKKVETKRKQANLEKNHSVATEKVAGTWPPIEPSPSATGNAGTHRKSLTQVRNP
ncbi:hypothetical protein Cgig2_020991 [Carnegiea gigantea]|uniref:Uncharacterized protein n=1 Tax=Carnegiea gigantea TaxID=171969 RepID=A0A9Q1KAY8_9CARY|nr:hypothetical protein Cgig2_020991 [Carnegiea gigantea]